MVSQSRLLVGALVLLFAAGCAAPTPTASPTRPPVFAAAPSPSPQPAPTATRQPFQVPTLAPPTSAPVSCANDATFVEDLTVPDGSLFAPGEGFDKHWLVRNSGTCDWGPGHRLVPLGENRLGGPAEMALFPAKAGASAEWQIDLVAPLEPGEYLGRWQARGPDGAPFGQEVFVLIFVELPTPTLTAAPTVTP